jgi:chemotaxis protein MotB
MSTARLRRRTPGIDYWPGFVDALSTLLILVVFLLSIFTAAQFVLSRDLSGRDDVLDRLNKQIADLTDLLALERAGTRTGTDTVASLSATLEATRAEAARLRGLAEARAGELAGAGGRQGELNRALEAERQLSARAAAQLEILNQQISAMRRQLAALEEALNVAENRDRESQTRIADLGSRLNVALAQKVQELSRYRSDFFGRLRQIIGNRQDIRIVGDRFVFQSEVFFASGEAELQASGRPELDKVADALLQLEREIPPDIPWVIRVDGHTDRRPVQGRGRYQSNWELSAGRAIAVVQYLVSRGISPTRLLAAGFGEFQPLDTGEGDEANRRNRRIELKLTER